MRIHCLQHVPFEGPGYIQQWAEGNGHELTSTSLYRDESLPDPSGLDLLVILGGPMGVYDEDRHPWLNTEKSFIRRCIDQQIKIIGICLGAQLLASTLGARVYSMSESEIGWFPIEWTSAARNPSLFSALPAQHNVLHWHGDTFELPKGATHLARSSTCKNQAFIVDDRILGLQFHLEMQPNDVSRLIEHSSMPTGSHVQSPEKIENSDLFDQANRHFNSVITHFMELDRNNK